MKRILKVVWRIGHLIALASEVALALFFPRNYKKLIFGAWNGRLFACNSRYLFEYFLRRGGFTCVWIGEEKLREVVMRIPGAKFAASGSLASYWHMLTAGFLVWNVSWLTKDTMTFPRCHRIIQFYLTHGYPDKRTGKFQFDGHGVQRKDSSGALAWRDSRNLKNRILDHIYGNESWCSCSSEQGVGIRLTCMPEICAPNRILRFGTPRADFFIHGANDLDKKIELRKKIAGILNLPTDKKWCLFVPTWRHEKEYLFSFTTSPKIAEYEQLLQGQNMILIEKQHPRIMADYSIKAGRFGSITVVSSEQSEQLDAQELLMAADRLITDYSSIYYDFVLMNRPVIHFTYDFDHFMNVDMGFMFDIREYGGGPFAYAEDELIKFMRMSDDELLKLRNVKTMEQLTFEKGHACEGYYNLALRMAKERGYFVQ